MRRLQQFRLFTTKDNKINLRDKNKYAIIILSENSKGLLDIYFKLNIERRYVKDIYIPKFMFKGYRFIPKGTLFQYVKRKYKLYGHRQLDDIVKHNRSFYYDFTKIPHVLLNKYKRMKGNRKLILIYLNLLNNYVSKFKSEGYKVILLYHVNLNKLLPPIFERLFYPILYNFRYNVINLNIDYLLLGKEISNQIEYSMLYRKGDDKFTYQRLLQTLKQLEYIEQIPEDLINDQIKKSNVTKDTIKVNDNISKINKNVKPEQSVTNKVITSPDTAIVSQKRYNELTDETIRYIAKSLAKQTKEKPETIYNKIKNNDLEKAKYLLMSLFNINAKDAIKIIKDNNNDINETKMKYLIDNVVSKIKVENTSIDPLMSQLDVKKLYDNQIKTDILTKRINESEFVIDENIKDIFQSYEKEKVPVKLVKIKKSIDLDPTEIFKSVTWKYEVTVKLANGKHQTITFKIPKIIDNNYIYINGMKKIIINQIVANPIYFYKKYSCYIRSIYASILVEYKTLKIPYFRTYVAGLRMPLILSLIISFGMDKVMKEFGISATTQKLDDENLYTEILTFKSGEKLYFYSNKKNPFHYLLNDVYHMKRYAQNVKFNEKYIWHLLAIEITKNNNVTYKVKAVNNNIINKNTAEILRLSKLPDNIIDIYKYILPKLKDGYFQVRNDLSKMRIRNVEIITTAVKKIFDLAYHKYEAEVNMLNKNADIIFNSNKIMSLILTKSLTQTADYINPLNQVSSIAKVTYYGEGGIDKNAEMLDVRVLHPSYFGIIDPVDTPIYNTIGMNQTLAINTTFKTKYGHLNLNKMTNDLKSGMLSLVSNTIPFIENDEPARCMMGVNQSKQALVIEGNEVPAVKTGFESVIGNFVSREFIVKSPVNGTVKHVDNNIIIITDNKTGAEHRLNIGNILLRSNQIYSSLSYIIPTVKQGQKVKVDQIVGYNKAFKNGEIANGINLLCAYMTYKGANYEDGIIISEQLAQSGRLTSYHAFTYEIFLKQEDRLIDYDLKLGQEIDNGHILVKFIPSNILELVGDLDDDEINDEQHVTIKAKKGQIIDIELYCNHKKLTPALKKLQEEFGDPTLRGKYKFKGQVLDGTLIKIYVKVPLDISLGDKLSNRHGNKGVITLIEKAEYMPRTPWGEPVDIILNPLGIYSRMNPGQLLELYSGLISWKLQELMKTVDRKKFIKIIDNVYSIFDKTKGQLLRKHFVNVLKKVSNKQYDELKARKFFPMVVPPFTAPKSKDIMKILKLLNLKEKYQLTLPQYGIKTKSAVPVGYVFQSKLTHLSTKKLSARSVGSYSKKTGQPQGKSSRGQKVGELDTWSLMSYNADNLLYEFFGPLSDDKLAKQQVIQQIIERGYANLPNTKMGAPNKDLTEAYMRIIGLEER